jgi:hypothetical protein
LIWRWRGAGNAGERVQLEVERVRSFLDARLESPVQLLECRAGGREARFQAGLDTHRRPPWAPRTRSGIPRRSPVLVSFLPQDSERLLYVSSETTRPLSPRNCREPESPRERAPRRALLVAVV